MSQESGIEQRDIPGERLETQKSTPTFLEALRSRARFAIAAGTLAIGIGGLAGACNNPSQSQDNPDKDPLGIEQYEACRPFDRCGASPMVNSQGFAGVTLALDVPANKIFENTEISFQDQDGGEIHNEVATLDGNESSLRSYPQTDVPDITRATLAVVKGVDDEGKPFEVEIEINFPAADQDFEL